MPSIASLVPLRLVVDMRLYKFVSLKQFVVFKIAEGVELAVLQSYNDIIIVFVFIGLFEVGYTYSSNLVT